jgi:O-antigen/teichoic acid export membrane protein
LSVYQFAQTFLVFLLALGLSMIRRDRLVTYAAGIALIGVTLAVIQAARCCTCFDECRFRRLKWDDLSDRLRQLVTFGGWTIFGALGAIGGNQGIAFLLNVFCGARMNTAFGIANQVSGQVAGVSQGILNAMAPEITASEGRGQRDRVVSLALRASKFTVLLLCMLLIPVLFEIDTLMRLWLKEVPPGTVTLCRVVLLAFLIDQLTIGYMMAIAAQGRISGYQATLGGSLICAPLIAWMVLLAGGNAVWAVGIGLLATRTVCSLGRLWWARQLMQVPMRRWFLAVPARSFATLAAPVCLALLIRACLSPSAMRMLVICGGCVAALGITGWAFGLDPQERAYLENGLRKARHMIRGAIIHT